MKYYFNEILFRLLCNWVVVFRLFFVVFFIEIKVEKIKYIEFIGVCGLFGCSRGEMVKYYILINLKFLMNNIEIILVII